MSRRIPRDANHSIAQQHLSQAIEAAVIAPGFESLWGYATLTGTRADSEIEVRTFPDRETMALALSETFKGRLLSDVFHTVYCFSPAKPIRMRAVIEWDDEDDFFDEEVGA